METKAECDGGECGLGGYCEDCPKRKPAPVEPDAWEREFLAAAVDPSDGI